MSKTDDIFEAGKQTCIDGKTMEHNPHHFNTKEWRLWRAGYFSEYNKTSPIDLDDETPFGDNAPWCCDERMVESGPGWECRECGNIQCSAEEFQ